MEDMTSVALRISQLDASELDHEIHNIFSAQFRNVFKYFKPHLLTKYEPEINAAFRFVIWKCSINVLESTIGQQILNLKYKDGRSSIERHSWMSPRQKLLYAVLVIGGNWASDRSHDLKRVTSDWPQSSVISKVLSYAEDGWKVASLLNFLVFLLNGRYQLLVERILGIRAVFPRPQSVRQVGFDYVSRELLWHGFAEFLFFILPLINFRRIKSFLSQTFLPKSRTLGGRRDYQECTICGEWPTNPHHIGCSHVFCYYCITSNTMADSGYLCPGCRQPVETINNIRLVQLEVGVNT
ncbi:peroxisome biogenesis factor 2-like [Lineus longissimus]|uniref:peroxisome biogenesis factor 2-like n=1 Tax=Lineus longissimus TaxID=88925 RepID=UPI002B4F31D0